jgi:hypothetical protein
VIPAANTASAPPDDDVARVGEVRGEDRRHQHEGCDAERHLQRAPQHVGRQADADLAQQHLAQHPLVDGEASFQPVAVGGPRFLQIVELHV